MCFFLYLILPDIFSLSLLPSLKHLRLWDAASFYGATAPRSLQRAFQWDLLLCSYQAHITVTSDLSLNGDNCCITNHYRLCALKQHGYHIISRFCRSEVGTVRPHSLLRVNWLNSRVSWVVSRWGPTSSSKPTTHRKDLFPSSSFHVVPPCSNQQWDMEPSGINPFDFLFALRAPAIPSHPPGSSGMSLF